MKKKNKNGFFLSETMVVITVVSVVLLGVFKMFSHVYTNYKQEERYNTINAINALSNIKKYFDNKGVSYDSITLNNGYADITNIQEYETDYFDAIKKEYSVDKLYLIDMSIEDKTFSDFNVVMRKYINTIKTSNLILLVQVNGSEYANVVIKENDIKLVGDAENDYVTYVKLGSSFKEPGYTSESNIVPTITWEPRFNSDEEGTYYMYYDFNGKILKRKVVVLELDKSFDYIEDEQIYISKLDGYYKLEVWGAQGGDATFSTKTYNGGYGGYSTGFVRLNKGDKLYINVGGMGQSVSSVSDYSSDIGYNGGSYGTAYVNNSTHGGGGGATHIATSSGLLKNLSNNISSILIVGGGGGGASTHSTNPNYSGNGGSGGGYLGVDGVGASDTCYAYGLGGSQTAAGSYKVCTTDGREPVSNNPGVAGFGYGSGFQQFTTGPNLEFAGGGGGYYGGNFGYHAPAGGGSGYIGNASLLTLQGTAKTMYCYNCTTSTNILTRTVSTTCTSETAKEKCTKIGNGYAKITYVG